MKNKKRNETRGRIWAVIMISIFVFGIAISMNANADEVVVTFKRELPFKSYEFTRTFEDKDAFEMWMAMRLEGKGCDPYLSKIVIDFPKGKSTHNFPAEP